MIERKRKRTNSAQKMDQEKQDEQVFHVYIFLYVKNLYYPSNKVHCDNCEKDITKHSRI